MKNMINPKASLGLHRTPQQLDLKAQALFALYTVVKIKQHYLGQTKIVLLPYFLRKCYASYAEPFQP